MRLRSVAVLAFVGFMACFSIAQAQEEAALRSFGNFNCRQQFQCSTAGQQNLASMADTCFQQGFGRSANLSSTTLDSNGCLTGTLGDNGKNSSQSQCCVIRNTDNTCGMTCATMMR